MGDVDLVWYLKEEETDSKFTLENEKHRVPLERLEYTLKRETEPLRHIISSALDWASITKRHLKFLEIVDAISDFLATHPSQKLGLNSLYRAMQTICKESGYSRRDFDAARQEYLRIQEEEAA